MESEGIVVASFISERFITEEKKQRAWDFLCKEDTTLLIRRDEATFRKHPLII
jgi:hypothetical protein